MHRHHLALAIAASALICCIDNGAAASSGGGSGKAAKGGDAAKDLVDQAQSGATPPAAELPPEVAEQLRLAAENIEALTARNGELETALSNALRDLEAAKGEGDDLAAEVASLKGEVTKLQGELVKAKAKSTAKDAITAAAAERRVERVEVTVKRGRFTHADAPDGVAREGEKFTAEVTSQEEAEDLLRHQARGVIALNAE